MKSMDADALRVQKLGSDNAGNTYWYFYGTRLYKEEAVEEKKTWNEEWKKQKKKSLETPKKRGRGRPRKVKVVNSEGESDEFEDVDKKNDGYMNVNEKSRWSVVCDTLEEWVNFAEKFKNSKSKEEKALFLIIQESFLPTLNKIYEEKEKKLQQKIKELMPVREKIVTRRETRKMRGEVFESPVVNGYEISDEAHKEHMIKDRARRLEERNKRASEADSVQIISYKKNKSDKNVPDGDEDSENRMTPFQKSDDKNMDLQCQVERLLSSVKLHKDAWPFLYPVNEEDAPAYYDIIKEPVDLSMIENRLFSGTYDTVGDLDADFDKMVANCELYNGEYHTYSTMARTLRKIFRKGMTKILESFQPESESPADSEGSCDSNYQSSSSSSSPPAEVSDTSPKHQKKPKERKKKKTVSEALELLAQASNIAVQNNSEQPSPPRKKSPPVQQVQTLSQHVPSANLPYHPVTTTSMNTSKVSLPVTSSNFVPVNPSVQNATKQRPLFMKINVPPNAQKVSTSVESSTSSNAVYSTSNSNTLPQNSYQTLCTNTLPGVFTGYNQSSNQTDARFKNSTAVPVQSNGMPVVQKVLISQPIQVSSNGQYMIATPQNTVRFVTKEHGNVMQIQNNVQMQNNVRPVDQSFTKSVPQLVAPTSLMPGYQLQAVTASNAQAFTQVTQSPQYVSIPTYMLSNQNAMQTNQQTTASHVVNLQPFQLAQRQMHISNQGNT